MGAVVFRKTKKTGMDRNEIGKIVSAISGKTMTPLKINCYKNSEEKTTRANYALVLFFLRIMSDNRRVETVKLSISTKRGEIMINPQPPKGSVIKVYSDGKLIAYVDKFAADKIDLPPEMLKGNTIDFSIGSKVRAKPPKKGRK